MHGDLSGRSCTLASGRCEMLYTLLDPINPPAKLLRGAWDMTVGAQQVPEGIAPVKVRLSWNAPLHPPRAATRARAVCFIAGSVRKRAAARRIAAKLGLAISSVALSRDRQSSPWAT